MRVENNLMASITPYSCETDNDYYRPVLASTHSLSTRTDEWGPGERIFH